jgi:hypothetical protein
MQLTDGCDIEPGIGGQENIIANALTASHPCLTGVAPQSRPSHSRWLCLSDPQGILEGRPLQRRKRLYRQTA